MRQSLYVCALFAIIAMPIYNSIAQVNGPSQPEFRKFQPVDIKDMVNEFTGTFTYSIPLLTVPGPNGSDYPLTLTYTSGSSPKEAASWVGFGWNIVTGAIIRNKNGWPDDYKNVNINFINRSRPNVTASATTTYRVEYVSRDKTSEENPINPVEKDDDKVAPSLEVTKITSVNTLTGTFQRKGFSLGATGGFLKGANLSASAMWDSKDNFSISGGADFTSYISDYILDNTGIKNNHDLNTYLGKTIGKNISAINSSPITGVLSQYLVPSFGFQGIATVFKPYNGTSHSIVPAVNFEIFQIKQEVDLSLGSMDVSSTETHDYTAPVFGYMYSAEAEADKNSIMDYSVEREGNYELRNLFLQIPYSSADNFEVTGADVQGGFRLYQAKVGCFRPNSIESKIKIWGWGAALGASLAPGFGFNIGADGNEGKQVMNISGWEINKNSFNTGSYWNDITKFFRFANDPGGSLLLADYNENFDIYHKSIFDNNVLDVQYHESGDVPLLQYLPSSYKEVYSGTAKLNSSQISYYTFGDYRNKEFISLNSFHSDKYYLQKISDIKGVKDEIIAGYSIKGKNGFTYNYGLPVFNRNELEFTYGLNSGLLTNSQEPVKSTYPDNAINPLLVYKQLDTNNDKSRVATGQIITDPYAGQFLLTEILTTDYVDLTNNGPTEDDLGGYVKFNYKRATVNNIQENDPSILNKNQPHDNYPSSVEEYNNQHKNWYRWRTPFNGLNYQKNSISDPQDDVGSMSSGETEIYYLESIETKTYIAFFITNKSRIRINKNNIDTVLQGSFIERKDGFSASINEYLAIADPSGGCPAPLSENLLRFLERIELYSKEIKNPIMSPTDTAAIRVGELIQTTHFDYDENYSIWPGQPNSLSNEYVPNTKLGKLTLKRVWSENGEAKDYTINPYVFGYTYPNIAYPSEFSSISNYGKNFVAPGDVANSSKIRAAQQPYYTPMATDRWGAYCSMEYTTNQGRYGVSQEREGTYSFDPAAYNLKTIELPGGGQIHVQYEQNQYSFVQRNNASVLAPICGKSGKFKDMTLEFDVQSIFGNPAEKTDEIGQEVEKILTDKYVASPVDTLNHDLSLLYCKLLFKQHLDGIQSSDPLNDRNYEYVNGYIKPKSATYDSQSKKLKVRFGIGDIREKGLQFYKSNRRDLIDEKNGRPSPNLYNSKFRDEEWACHNATKYVYSSIDDAPDDVLYSQLSLENSYVRLPFPPQWSKLGGGIRVKRLLMFNVNNGPEYPSQSNLYGSEYFYEDDKGNCSGVASNEPNVGREENALVNMLRTQSKSTDPIQYTGNLSFTSGPRDLEQGEGPIGEYLLPSPSVGYSSIYQKSIISGKRGNYIRNDGGIVRKQYYTTKDYPYLAEATGVIKTEKKRPSLISLYSVTNHYIRCSQGYRFILNNMNGQPKSVETYAGTIFKEANGATVYNFLDKTPTSKTEYEYYDYLKPIPIYDGDLFNRYWGVDEEIITESRHVQDLYENKKVEGDASFEGWFVPKSVSFAAQFSKIKTDLYTHVTNKIIRMPVFLKSITTTTDGIIKKITQYGFDCNTGKALFTYTPDEFALSQGNNYNKNFVSSMQIPASFVNPGMRQISQQRGGFVEKQYKSNSLVKICRRIDYDQENGKNEYSLVFSYNTVPTGSKSLGNPDSTEEYLGCWESQYTQMYEPGDILKVIPQRGYGYSNGPFYEEGYNATGAENYRVISQKGHIVKLEPLFYDSTKIYPSSKMISDVMISRKGSMNLLTEDYASFITYGPDSNNYLKNYSKRYKVNARDSVKRQKFNDFLNYALYAASTSGSNSPMSIHLQRYSEITNTPLASLVWSFEGLESKPTTISFANIDKFLTLKGRHVNNCIIYDTLKSITKTGITVFYDTLNIYLFPSVTAQSVNLNNLYFTFVDNANAVLNSINIMRFDEAMPDVNWDAIIADAKPLNQEICKRLFDVIGYSKVINNALFFDSGDFRWYGSGLEQSYRKGENIFTIDPNSIKFEKRVEGGVYIKEITGNVKNNQDKELIKFHKNDLARFSLAVDGNRSLLKFADKEIGTVYTNKTQIPPDTISIKLFWSRDHDVVSDNYFQYIDNSSLKVFLYNEKNNCFSLYYAEGSPDKCRYYGDSVGHDSLTRDIHPRSWFWGDLTALKFNTENDTLVNSSEFALKGSNRLISGSIKYYDDNWPDPDSYLAMHPINFDDPFSTGIKGKFRLKAEYIYDDLIDDDAFNKYNQLQTPLQSSILTDAKVYKGLQYPLLESFEIFNGNPRYRDSIKDNWSKSFEITKRLTDGKIVEFVDNNNVKRSFYYGYPALINGNAQIETITKNGDDFVSLEAINAGYGEALYQPWTHGISEKDAHSGNCDSNFRNGSCTAEILRGIRLEDNSLYDGVDYSKGLLCRVWAKDTASQSEGCKLKIDLVIFNNWPNIQSSSNMTYNMNKVCQTGEWSLYEVEIRDINLTNYVKSIAKPNNIIAKVNLGTLRADYNSIIYDDFIIQPLSSSVSSYMYNFNNRHMSVVLDENHFATYYSYNDIGQPDKVHKETLSGFRTVAQSEYNLIGTGRSDRGPMIQSSLYKGPGKSEGDSFIDEKNMDMFNYQGGYRNEANPILLKKKSNNYTLDEIFFNKENSPIKEYENSFDVFDLKLTPDGQDFKIMNSDFKKDSLDKFINKARTSLNNENFDVIDSSKIDIEQYKLQVKDRSLKESINIINTPNVKDIQGVNSDPTVIKDTIIQNIHKSKNIISNSDSLTTMPKIESRTPLKPDEKNDKGRNNSKLKKNIHLSK